MKLIKILKRLFFKVTGYLPGENKEIRRNIKISERLEEDEKYFKRRNIRYLLAARSANGEKTIDLLINNLYQLLYDINNLYSGYDMRIEYLTGQTNLLNAIQYIVENDYGYPETKVGLVQYLKPGREILMNDLNPFTIYFSIRINLGDNIIKVHNSISYNTTLKEIAEAIDIPHIHKNHVDINDNYYLIEIDEGIKLI